MELENELGFKIFERSRSGIAVSPKGQEFVRYIQTIAEQVSIIEEKYVNRSDSRVHFSVSTQHYLFSVSAFVRLLREEHGNYQMNCLETRTMDVINNVANDISEIGILYFAKINENVITRELKNRNLAFHLLFSTTPHVFFRKGHPLLEKDCATIDDLKDYPFISFSQGPDTSYSFSEEVVPMPFQKQNIHIQDRGSLMHILINTDAYSIGSGIFPPETSNAQSRIASIPLLGVDKMSIGWIQKNGCKLSPLAQKYLRLIKKDVPSELRKTQKA